MSTVTERLFTGITASAAFSVMLFAEMHYLEDVGGAGLLSLIVILLYVLPVYLTIGTAASVVVDGVVVRMLGGTERNRVLSYAGHVLGYAAAGYAIYILLYLALFGRPVAGGLTVQALFIGIPGALIYYHVSLAVRTFSYKSHLEKFGAPVETERLLLVPCTLEQYEQAMSEGYPIGSHVTSYIDALRRFPKEVGWGVWFVRLKENGKLIGDAGFKGSPDYMGTVDIGYGFLPEYWGKGYATETAGALVAWAFEHGAGRVTAETLRDNTASMNVLRKSGFRLYREDEHYHWRIDAGSWKRPSPVK